MATKTKSGGGTLAAFVAVVVVAGFAWGYVKRAPSDERSGVVLSVMFEPTERVSFVDITVTVNGVPAPVRQVRKSPWSMTLQNLQRGQKVVLIASQVVPSKLACAINGEVQETRDTPGTVLCTHTRA